jgi:hypothetical protein
MSMTVLSALEFSPVTNHGCGSWLSFSCFLAIATQGHFVLFSRDPRCLLCKELTEEDASSTQAPPNHREFVPAK